MPAATYFFVKTAHPSAETCAQWPETVDILLSAVTSSQRQAPGKHQNLEPSCLEPGSSAETEANPSNPMRETQQRRVKRWWPGAHTTPEKKRGQDKQARAARGSQNTFAGRRPPRDPEKLALFNQMRVDYERVVSESRLQVSKVRSWERH